MYLYEGTRTPVVLRHFLLWIYLLRHSSANLVLKLLSMLVKVTVYPLYLLNRG